MRILICLMTVIIFCFSCTKKTTLKKYKFQKITCTVKKYESFDSTFFVNQNKIRLLCNTECFNDYSISDTINDSIINLYQDRFFKFSIMSNNVDTQIVVSKTIIKNIYNNNSTYNNSVLALPRIEKIYKATHSILIHSLFVYPRGLDGTNFLEEITFELSMKGKITSVKVLPPYEELESIGVDDHSMNKNISGDGDPSRHSH